MFKDLEISYDTWKTIVQANSYQNYHVVNGPDNVTAITGNREIIFWAEVDANNYGDWNTNFGPNSSTEASENDAFAKVYGLTVQPIARTADGKQFVAPSTFNKNLGVYFCNRGDDVDNNLRLRGPFLKLSKTDEGDAEFIWQYIDPVYISGGMLVYENALFGDYIRYQIIAPASPCTNNPGAGIYDKVPNGEGGNLFVPNATQQGDWDLNLAEKLNNNVNFTKVTPIQVNDNTGFFDYDITTQAVVLNTSQTGNCHLFDADYILTEFVNDVHVIGSREKSFLVPASFAARELYPHWKHKVMIHRSGNGTINACWDILVGREKARP